jgi:lambda family phage tail tape measure protein
MGSVANIAVKDFTGALPRSNGGGGANGSLSNPDLLGGGGRGGGGANLGKLNTAAADEMERLQGEKEALQLAVQQEAIQDQIAALQLKGNQYAHDHNSLAEELNKIEIAHLGFKQDSLKAEADYKKALADDATQKDEGVRAAKDELAYSKLSLELDKAKNKEINLINIAKQQYNFLIDDEARKQRETLEDIGNKNKYTMIGATKGADIQALAQEWDKLKRQVQENTLSAEYATKQYDAMVKSYKEMQALGNNVNYGIAKGAQDYISGIGTLADSVASATKGALGQLETELTSFFETGKLNFKAFADYAIKELMRIVLEQTLLKPLAQGIGGLFNFGGGAASAISGLGNAAFSSNFVVPNFSFANGGIMSASGSIPLNKYAGGGVANSPQMALFGEGSMPEAYVPLPDGRRIPVNMKNGGSSSPVINVAVDAKGTSVSGNRGQGEALGRAIAASVQAELIKQKRPGGLLAA